MSGRHALGRLTATLLLCFGTSHVATQQRFNVSREMNQGDLFSFSQPNCSIGQQCLYGNNATVTASVGATTCRCRCPREKPTFLQNTAECVALVVHGDCPNVIGFVPADNRNSSAVQIPSMFLPLANNMLHPKQSIDWNGSHVDVRSDGTVQCLLGQTGYLTESGWHLIVNSGRLFALSNINNNMMLVWKGTKKSDRLRFRGKLVQLTVICGGNQHHCILFRIVGDDAYHYRHILVGSAATSVVRSRQDDSPLFNVYSLAVAVVSAVLVLLTLLSAVILWIVCWRYKKEQLTSSIHKKLMYLQQRSQQQNGCLYSQMPYGSTPQMIHEAMMQPSADNYGQNVLAHYGLDAADAATLQLWASRHDGAGLNGCPPQSQQELSRVMNAPAVPPLQTGRRKLYFSPEFFHPQHMANPPQVAEEFLYEVRRMIDVAKTRIRARRFNPSLFAIAEDHLREVDEEPSEADERCRVDETTGRRFDVIMEDIDEAVHISPPDTSPSDSPASASSPHKESDDSGFDGEKETTNADTLISVSIEPPPQPTVDPPKERVSSWLQRLGLSLRDPAANIATSSSGNAEPKTDSPVLEMKSSSLLMRYGMNGARPDVRNSPWFNRRGVVANGGGAVRRGDQTSSVIFPSESPIQKSLPRLNAISNGGVKSRRGALSALSSNLTSQKY